jgi:hypothetical protein
VEPSVLDLAQLARIQGTHRGFLYQHLYSAACLLSSPKTGVVGVRVERDEDLELVHSHEVIYAQIKTREALLAPSDIEGMLERFERLRTAHHAGQRKDVPRFALVTNTELGPNLARSSWPSDVLVLTPSTPPHVFERTGLVAPAPNVGALLHGTLSIAEEFRLSALRPESLVSKLVGVIAQAAAGEPPGPSFARADLENICELVAAQIRPLPKVVRYRSQIDEPKLPDGRGSLIVVGHSGDGKSAWAAEVAPHMSDVAVYLPCSSAPGEQMAPRLVEAVVATLVARGDFRPHHLVLPGRTGIDALALLDRELTIHAVSLTAIIDDCHHLAQNAIVDAMRAAPHIRYLLLGRPCDALDEVAALLSLPRARLGGWDDDTIAALLHDEGCSTKPAEVSALRSATKGAPLFVLHAIQAISSAGKDTGEYARQLVLGTTAGRSPQEVLLEAAVRALDPVTAKVGSALAAIDAGFQAEEWAQLLARTTDDGPSAIRRALRFLVDHQLAHESERGLVGIHDAFRPLLDGRFLSEVEVRNLRGFAADLIRVGLQNERTSERLVAYVRLLASIGRLSELADVANALAEWFQETGTISEVRGHLEASARERELSAEDQFWALDTLVFFDIEDKKLDQAESRLPELRRLAEGLGDHARGAVLHKEILIALLRGDVDTIRKLMATPPADARYSRILRYHSAIAEAQAGQVELAVSQLLDVATEYLSELGLTVDAILGKNVAELRGLIRPSADSTDVRHLADCYHAIVCVSSGDPERRKNNALFAIWAMKFYDLAGAVRSVLRAGQDAVDLMLGLEDDAEAARAFIEQSLLPVLGQARLPEMTIPIRSQYAVVCARCGDFARADAVMAAVAPYADGLPTEGRGELENQRALIERLRARGPMSPSQLAARRRRAAGLERRANEMRAALGLGSPPPNMPPLTKIGRNSPCPCGSGQKYKKCHGKPE